MARDFTFKVEHLCQLTKDVLFVGCCLVVGGDFSSISKLLAKWKNEAPCFENLRSKQGAFLSLVAHTGFAGRGDGL